MTGKAGAGITILVLIGVVLAGIFWLTARGFSAAAEPSVIEAFIAENLLDLSIPSQAKAMENPNSALAAERLSAAQDRWVEHCAVCHDLDGSGDTPVGKNLYPKPPDMRRKDTQEASDGAIFYIISNGVRFTGMPAWGEEESKDDLWDLVSYIRRLPELSPEELELLKRKASELPIAEQFSEEESGHREPSSTPTRGN